MLKFLSHQNLYPKLKSLILDGGMGTEDGVYIVDTRSEKIHVLNYF